MIITSRKWFFVAISVGLIATTLLGIYMPFKYNRSRVTVWGLLTPGSQSPQRSSLCWLSVSVVRAMQQHIYTSFFFCIPVPRYNVPAENVVNFYVA